MPCCSRKVIKKTPKKKISLGILRSRRDLCRVCKHATKNPHPKFARFGGLTNVSKCKKAKRTISDITSDPDFACPIDKFAKVS